MALSRAVFGQRGNLLPGALIWVARWGWETVNAVTGAYAVLTVLDLLFAVRTTTALIMATLLFFVASSFLVSGLGASALRVVLHLVDVSLRRVQRARAGPPGGRHRLAAVFGQAGRIRRR